MRADFDEKCAALVRAAASELTAKRAHAAVAESLTGGMLSSMIVNVPGSSGWFAEGCVTYSNEAKIRTLGVSPAMISEHTAVSRPVAKAMAEGLLMKTGADVAVSTTGLAGPGADELGREAGLVFIGGAAKFGSVTRELMLSGDRNEIRRDTVLAALSLLAELAKLV
ncbi:MAG: nicotinamide-nucleotide amidohydrolase family protein [Clostridia bacterium]|nr:nicotinamide-nucleotide amidohydrolase family protein [Clostridia bacterium]